MNTGTGHHVPAVSNKHTHAGSSAAKRVKEPFPPPLKYHNNSFNVRILLTRDRRKCCGEKRFSTVAGQQNPNIKTVIVICTSTKYVVDTAGAGARILIVALC
jgi:hypothetical protein